MGFFKDAIDTSPDRRIARLHTLIWASIYAGLLLLVLGIATRRGDAVVGWVLIVVGALLATVGFVLIWVRSRLGQRTQQP